MKTLKVELKKHPDAFALLAIGKEDPPSRFADCVKAGWLKARPTRDPMKWLECAIDYAGFSEAPLIVSLMPIVDGR